MAIVLTVAIVAASISGAGIVTWLVLDQVFLISREISEPVKDITGTLKEVVTSPAGKVGVAGMGLLAAATGIGAILAMLRKSK